MAGRLYICPTPIGNLQDVTLRVLRVLAEADVIAAEDTRRTRKLLTAHGVRARRLVSFHEANEADKTEALVERLRRGEQVALVSDAGMPLISDPGYRLVTRCIEEGLSIEVLPGPSAVTAALAASGLPTDRFSFEGFMPRKDGDRRRRLESIASDERTLIFFEAPNRVGGTLESLKEVLGNRRIALVRELSKVHEQVLRGTIEEVASMIGEEIIGEVVMVVGGAPRPLGDLATAIRKAQELMSLGNSPSRAAAAAASGFGVPKRQIYDAIVAQSGEKGSQD